MRTETYFASAALVTQLERAGGVAHVHHDGGDIIHLELRSREHILLHLIESSIPVAEVVATLEANRARHHYTLFMFWADRLLPPDGQMHHVEDWMRPLLALYDERLFGYEVHGRQIFVFPVFFEGSGERRRIRHGGHIDATYITCRAVPLRRDGLDGQYYAAELGARPTTQAHPPLHPLASEYARLGLEVDAELRAVKHAYRKLARHYHPDINADAAATQQMQQINEAYRRILRAKHSEMQRRSRR